MAVSSLAARAAAAALLVLATLPALAQSPTRTRLVTQSPSPAGQPVTMTAEVDTFAGGPPTGAVAFADNGTSLGYASLNVLGAGQATIAAGGYHTCGLTNGVLECWGDNFVGQLGFGSVSYYHEPIPVWGLFKGLSTGVVAVAAGGIHSCALTNIGAVLCWGGNFDGQIGDGTTTTAQRFPRPVVGLSAGSGVQGIAAGSDHTCSVSRDGQVMCWGRGGEGQLGDGGTASSNVPRRVIDQGTRYVSVAAGGRHTCGLTSAGAVKCWGANDHGQLGNGASGASRPLPVAVSGLPNGVVAVTAGASHTCAVTATGALKCWGSNLYGAIGDGSTTDRVIPAQVLGLQSGVVAASSGSLADSGNHTCALLNTGSVRCWGSNSFGQLGDGTTTLRRTPVSVANLGGAAVALTSGGLHNCALLSPTRILRCWGYAYSGQLGDGDYATYRPLPRTTIRFWGVLRGRARLAATLAAGSHPLRAYFPGDAARAPSVSPIVTHTVQ